MQKKWTEYQLILFDMDGTLYFQRPLQIHMGLKMLLSCLTPGGLREMIIVLKFRRLREHWKRDTNQLLLQDNDIDQVHYQLLSNKTGIPTEEIEKVVHKWIYQKPLQILMNYRDDRLAEILKKYHLHTQVAIYSDYSVSEKRKALDLDSIPCFYGGQKEIACLKPDPRGIEYIMDYYHITDHSNVLMIGDRFSKDGLAALSAGVDYIILKKHRFQRTRQYQTLTL